MSIREISESTLNILEDVLRECKNSSLSTNRHFNNFINYKDYDS